jgi:2-succinyl-5-enolpyruvyl-6-hydroxy-3-cyclohexene-1-carboxylate synthase
MNPSTALAEVLVDELVRGGCREAVVSPGSRSAPLAMALHAADAAGRLRLHVRIDERSAGFLALGLAKASAAPVPVLTTSGTATANLHPAVLEAAEAGVPLVVLTADRPPELRATGANQTVGQLGLFGDAVRLFHEVGAPVAERGQHAYWRALVCRALAAATGVLTRDPGPVHLNVALREPLVPDGDPTWVEPLAGRPDGTPWTRVVGPPVPGPAPTLVPAGGPRRTLVLVGDAPAALGEAAVRLAEACGWPVLSEPSGNARSGPLAMAAGALLLADPAWDRLRPDRVLVVGRPTLARPVQALLQDPRVRVDVVTPTARWADAARSAARVLPALPTPPPADPHHAGLDAEWLADWRTASAAAAHAVDAVLDELPAAEPRVARDLLAALPAGALLVAGSSMPVRDLFVAGRPRTGVRVLANRGAAGIDGTVSTAVGAALAWQAAGGGPAFALLGDLTLLHDANGLVLGPDEPRPDLTLVVLDNDGGAIFGLLEQGAPEHAASFERVFGTPHGVDLAALCGATGTPLTRVSTAAEAVAAALDPRAGLQVVQVRTDRRAVPGLQARLRAAVAAAVTAALPAKA